MNPPTYRYSYNKRWVATLTRHLFSYYYYYYYDFDLLFVHVKCGLKNGIFMMNGWSISMLSPAPTTYEVYIYLSLIWMRHLIIKWKHLKLTDLCIVHHTIIMDEFIKIKYIAWNVYVYNFQWGSSITEMTKMLYTDWILYITFIHNFKFKSSNRFAT